MEKIIRAIILAEEDGCTIEEYLKKRLNFTKRQISQVKFRRNGICVNEVQKRISYKLQSQDEIAIKVEEEKTASTHLVPFPAQIQVLYEDEDVMVVNKPAGVVVHPSPGHYEDSLANMLVHYFAERKELVKVRAIGRLDRETSGIVIFAKNQVAAGRLARQRAEGKLSKEYLALVHGRIIHKKGTVSKSIGKAKDSLFRMCTCETGKEAVTDYEVLKKEADFSMLKVKLQTGRTHQIRVHMASIGHPLLGDMVYGGTRDRIERTALHAWKVRFQQPFSGEEICVEAEIPEDISRAGESRNFFLTY